jgi:hypothetical protein
MLQADNGEERQELGAVGGAHAMAHVRLEAFAVIVRGKMLIEVGYGRG